MTTRPLEISHTVRLSSTISDLRLSSSDIYWVEQCPEHHGRRRIVRLKPDGQSASVLDNYDVRSLVQGYGGGAFCIHEDTIFFVRHDDQRIYCKVSGRAPVAITPVGPYAYGDLHIDRTRHRIICVRETSCANQDVLTEIVAVSFSHEAPVNVLVTGRDFYCSPRPSPCGRWLSWVSWNYPNMPWDESSVCVGELDESGSNCTLRHEFLECRRSAIEPKWSRSGELYFLWDINGWWNPFRFSFTDGLKRICDMALEFGFPPYTLGLSTYTIVEGNAQQKPVMIAAVFDNGQQRLLVLNLNGSGNLFELPTEYREIRHLQAAGSAVFAIGATAVTPFTPLRIDWARSKITPLHTTAESPDQACPVSEHASFPTPRGHRVWFNLYRPLGASARSSPLIVNVHGGPTGIATTAYNVNVHFWTSRGFNYLDVNYSGSCGFGRAYRESINRSWGVTDVQDCVDAVRYVCQDGSINRRAAFIRGQSAGGYTALLSSEHPHVYKGAVSYYGVSNLASLTRQTHKFESHYLSSLVGPLPDTKSLYFARSPINRVDRVCAPILLIQGGRDRIVPQPQSTMLHDRLIRRGKDSTLVEFPEEGHGFDSLLSKTEALRAEERFYQRVLRRASYDR